MITFDRSVFPEVKVFTFENNIDNRGLKYKSFSERELKKMEIDFIIKEEIIYCIPKKDTIYGIHFQNIPKQQKKIVSLVSGSGIDYIIDLRKDSKTFKKWTSIEINEDNHKNVLIPNGFGHLFRSTTDNVIMLFKIDEEFDRNFSKTLSYKDPDINLDISNTNFIVSDYDMRAPFLNACEISLTPIQSTLSREI